MLTLGGLKRSILEFLQGFYAEGRLYNPVDNSIIFQFVEDENKSNLLIRDGFVFNSAELGTKPTIILDRGVMRPIKASMKQREAHDWETGKTTYLDVAQVPFVLHCISSNDEEAETLAFITGMAFWIHRDLLKYDGKHVIEFDAVGTPSILIHERGDEGRTIYDVPVHITSWMHIGFSLSPKDPQTFEGIEGEPIKELRLRN
jgi:hypothetical protein